MIIPEFKYNSRIQYRNYNGNNRWDRHKPADFLFLDGFDWDLMPFSERGDSGINITASGEFLLGGTIGIADTLDDYASAAWGRDREFVIFNMDSSSKRPQGELKGVISNTTQSSTVD